MTAGEVSRVTPSERDAAEGLPTDPPSRRPLRSRGPRPAACNRRRRYRRRDGRRRRADSRVGGRNHESLDRKRGGNGRQAFGNSEVAGAGYAQYSNSSLLIMKINFWNHSTTPRRNSPAPFAHTAIILHTCGSGIGSRAKLHRSTTLRDSESSRRLALISELAPRTVRPDRKSATDRPLEEA